MKSPSKNTDLRHLDTSGALTTEERRAIQRQRQREALGLTGPRVKISSLFVPARVAKQFAYIHVGAR
ncbi:hypothetical protein [Caballeronia telluris]|uniref:Uncharacterized protein n=1 Tax=Caballeronia telluris TaxID=326475 RepID=A0A158G443_9BURK|nr:hypothetical protein [Caballeronia telluris]SAL26190.1 hypothetical protein AWB66_01518 [Caballeronia telluris]